MYKKYLYASLLGYSLLLFSFGTYVDFSSRKRLVKLYEGKDGYIMEGIVIESDNISENVLIFTSLILGFYSAAKLKQSDK